MGFMKYILISLGVVLLIIFGIVIFNRGGTEKPRTSDKKSVTLAEVIKNDDSSVEYNVAGEINATENHRAIQIIISPTSRTVNVYTGYEGQILNTQTYTNNKNAYSDFITALGRAGFSKERRIDANINPQAICPTGSRTHYKIFDGSQEQMDRWTASCASGSYGGNVSLTNTLFTAQIPDYNTITKGVSINTSSPGGIF